MNIEELASLTGGNLLVNYNAHLGIWQARFEDCDTKDGAVLCGEWGGGQTPTRAVDQYAGKIRGKVLVFHAWTDRRREFLVPSTLENP